MNNGEPSLDEKIAAATGQANGVMNGHGQVPAGYGAPPAQTPPEWIPMEGHPGYEIHVATRQWRQAQTAPAPTPYAPGPAAQTIAQYPVAPTQAQPQAVQYVAPVQQQLPQQPFQATVVQAPMPFANPGAPVGYVPPGPTTIAHPGWVPPSTAVPPGLFAAPHQPPAPAGLPPIVPLVVGPDGQPPGSINAPEGRGLPDKLEPAPVTAATGAIDDLDAMSKVQLVALTQTMGIPQERLKNLREKGLKDLIRAARMVGPGATAAPPGVAAIGNSATGAGPIGAMPSGAPVRMTVTGDSIERVVDVSCALIGAGYLQHGPEQMVALAKQIVAIIEK